MTFKFSHEIDRTSRNRSKYVNGSTRKVQVTLREMFPDYVFIEFEKKEHDHQSSESFARSSFTDEELDELILVLEYAKKLRRGEVE